MRRRRLRRVNTMAQIWRASLWGTGLRSSGHGAQGYAPQTGLGPSDAGSAMGSGYAVLQFTALNAQMARRTWLGFNGPARHDGRIINDKTTLGPADAYGASQQAARSQASMVAPYGTRDASPKLCGPPISLYRNLPPPIWSRKFRQPIAAVGWRRASSGGACDCRRPSNVVGTRANLRAKFSQNNLMGRRMRDFSIDTTLGEIIHIGYDDALRQCQDIGRHWPKTSLRDTDDLGSTQP